MNNSTEPPKDNGKPNSQTDSPKMNRIPLSTLPTPLQYRVIKQYITAGLIVILTIIWLSFDRQIYCCTGLVVAGALLYLAVALKIDYVAGRIEEHTLLLATVARSRVRERVKVVFRTNEELPKYYEFYIPGKRHRNLEPNHVYLLYFRTDNPAELLAYTML